MLDATCELIIIRIPQRLDRSTAAHLAQDLDTQIPEGNGIVLDFSQTQVLEPDVAYVVQQGLKLARQHGVQMSLRAVPASVKQSLEAAGVLQHFRQV
jgi:anti-anti-sigma regulatory factor